MQTESYWWNEHHVGNEESFLNKFYFSWKVDFVDHLTVADNVFTCSLISPWRITHCFWKILHHEINKNLELHLAKQIKRHAITKCFCILHFTLHTLTSEIVSNRQVTVVYPLQIINSDKLSSSGLGSGQLWVR